MPGTNVVEVFVDTTHSWSRWYPGAGLYRNVRLVTTDDVFLPADELFFTTPSVTAARATATVSGIVRSRRAADADGVVTATLSAPDGRVLPIEIEESRREALLLGLDTVTRTLQKRSRLVAVNMKTVSSFMTEIHRRRCSPVP